MEPIREESPRGGTQPGPPLGLHYGIFPALSPISKAEKTKDKLVSGGAVISSHPPQQGKTKK